MTGATQYWTVQSKGYLLMTQKLDHLEVEGTSRAARELATSMPAIN